MTSTDGCQRGITKIVFVSHSALLGGAELALLELVSGLTERSVAATVVVPAGGPLVEALESLGVPTVVEPFYWWAGETVRPWSLRLRAAGRNASASWRIARHIRIERPNVVVTNSLVNPVGAFASALARAPHLWFVHEFGVRDHGMTFDLGYPASLRIVSWLSRRIAVNSLALQAHLEPFARERVRLVRYAVDVDVNVDDDPERSDWGANDTLRAVLVGRLTPSKGQEDAILAVAALRRRGLDVTLDLIGPGPAEYVRALQQRADDAGVGDLVSLKGYRSTRRSLFTGYDVALVCSRAEAFGRVTVEAMKSGVPVVGAHAAGTAELIDHGRTGLLYEPGDVADLADAIAALATDRLCASELARNGRAWANQTFTRARFVTDFLAVTDEALHSARRPRRWRGGWRRVEAAAARQR